MTEVVLIIYNIKPIKKIIIILFFMYKWVPALSRQITMNTSRNFLNPKAPVW